MARVGQMRNGYRSVAEKPEGKRPCSMPVRRWRIIIRQRLKK